MDLEDLYLLGACSMLKVDPQGQNASGPNDAEIKVAVQAAKKVWREVLDRKNDDE